MRRQSMLIWVGLALVLGVAKADQQEVYDQRGNVIGYVQTPDRLWGYAPNGSALYLRPLGFIYSQDWRFSGNVNQGWLVDNWQGIQWDIRAGKFCNRRKAAGQEAKP